MIFPPLFRTWLKECITSPRYSMSINGELTGFFKGEKWLRQGDCISPYLFIMVMEALSKFLENVVGEGKVRLHPQCEDPQITHLLFADDLLIFSDGSRHSLSGISSVMA
uniref:Reverse transcriptase domain-containing protein n=1 Tax=Brassica oleracea var. oleracea TaxID=109376 RepID=A0A0D3CH72_BRAOL